MHYIDYIPGSPAFISPHPSLAINPQVSSPDINELSRIVCKFNDYLKRTSRLSTKLDVLSTIAARPTTPLISLP